MLSGRDAVAPGGGSRAFAAGAFPPLAKKGDTRRVFLPLRKIDYNKMQSRPW